MGAFILRIYYLVNIEYVRDVIDCYFSQPKETVKSHDPLSIQIILKFLILSLVNGFPYLIYLFDLET